ncbi:MAG: glycosyltransferase [Myxococcota bacterium]
MIFVTVGGQGPFDRLVGTVDAWAGETGRADVFAQIGANATAPSHLEWVESLSPAEFRDRLASADVVISHAGMGTILTAREIEKPILVMPRQARLGEQRNDHQLATAKRLHEIAGTSVAADEAELRDWLGRLEEVRVQDKGESPAYRELLAAIGAFVEAARIR